MSQLFTAAAIALSLAQHPFGAITLPSTDFVSKNIVGCAMPSDALRLYGLMRVSPPVTSKEDAGSLFSLAASYGIRCNIFAARVADWGPINSPFATFVDGNRLYSVHYYTCEGDCPEGLYSLDVAK
jgi:hypothetical protein